MKKLFSYCLFFLFAFTQTAWAQNSISFSADNGIRVSMLTCGPGLDLYSGFGHSGIRVIDSTKRTDEVYNYGTFDFNDPNFYSKFTRGKLLYYLNVESFRQFIYTYQIEKRSVYEQVLNLTPSEENEILNRLNINALEENKYYKYDFLYDNCATRQLEIFKTAFSKSFAVGKAIEPGTQTFRDFTNHYLRNNHWTRVGINLLLSTPVDKKMSNEQAMFLPDYLMKGFRDATLNGKPIVAQTIEILPETIDFSPLPNTPRMVLWLFGLVGFLIWLKARSKMVYFDTFLFLIAGLLGCVMLFMWFGTDHQSCSWNRNLFWALPTHLIFAFLIPRKHKWIQPYARISFYVLLLALVWNLWAPQTFIVEITPIIILLLWRLYHYRRNPEKNQFYGNIRNLFSQFQQTQRKR